MFSRGDNLPPEQGLTQKGLVQRLADWRARFLKKDQWLGIDEDAINQIVAIIKKHYSADGVSNESLL